MVAVIGTLMILYLCFVFFGSVYFAVRWPYMIYCELKYGDDYQLNALDKPAKKPKQAKVPSTKPHIKPPPIEDSVDKEKLSDLTLALVGLGYPKAESKAHASLVIQSNSDLDLASLIKLCLTDQTGMHSMR